MTDAERTERDGRLCCIQCGKPVRVTKAGYPYAHRSVNPDDWYHSGLTKPMPGAGWCRGDVYKAVEAR